jgi:hypothetical protein
MYQCIQTDTKQELSAFQVAQAYAPKNSPPQSANRVSLNPATWHNLPNKDKAKWDTLSPTGKSAIINGTCQRGLEVAETHKTVKLKYTPNTHSTNVTSSTPTSITNTCKVNMKDIESVLPVSKFSDTLESNYHIQFASAQENSTDTNYPSENFLVNLAKSHLLPSDICSILSQPTNQNIANARYKTPQDTTKNLSVGFHNLLTPTPFLQWSEYWILFCAL